MSEGKFGLPLPDGMPADVLTKEFFAERYGFTEAMTEELSVEAIDWWPRIARAKIEVENKKMRDAQRQSQGPRRG